MRFPKQCYGIFRGRRLGFVGIFHPQKLIHMNYVLENHIFRIFRIAIRLSYVFKTAKVNTVTCTCNPVFVSMTERRNYKDDKFIMTYFFLF